MRVSDWLPYALLGLLAAISYLMRRRTAAQDKEDPGFAKLMRVVDEAERLRRRDPEAADRMIAEAEAELQATFEAEMAELRRRAPTDVAAAKQLRTKLKETIKGTDLSVRFWRKQVGKDPKAHAVLANLEQDRSRMHNEVRELDLVIARRA